MVTSWNSPRSGKETPAVRIVSSTADPYDGLKGHAYISARGLAAQVQRVQTSAHDQSTRPCEPSNGL